MEKENIIEIIAGILVLALMGIGIFQYNKNRDMNDWQNWKAGETITIGMCDHIPEKVPYFSPDTYDYDALRAKYATETFEEYRKAKKSKPTNFYK